MIDLLESNLLINNMQIFYCNFINDYVIKLENSLSFNMKKSQFQNLGNFNGVLIKFCKNTFINKFLKGDLFNKHHKFRVYKFNNRRLLISK